MNRSKRSRRDRSDRELRLDIARLELACGHDGFLRGAPEPVLLAGLYAADNQGLHLLGRGISRFAVPNRFPCEVEAAEASVIRYAARLEEDQRAVALLIALEEDSGEDLARVYAALERAGDLAVCPIDTAVPTPEPLAALAEGSAGWRRARLADLLLNGAQFDATCGRDKWVGAVAFASGPSELGQEMRAHFRSDDGLNDWTALVTLKR